MRSNLVLIGYRGTGKSTVGKLLAERKGFSYAGMDAEIVKAAGMEINEIVDQHGWDWFRDLESRVAVELAAGERAVIDTGGGVVLREENMAALGKTGRIILLTAPVHTIGERLRDTTDRPSLTGRQSFLEEIATVLAEREPLYNRYAERTISTEGKSPESITSEIIRSIVSP